MVLRPYPLVDPDRTVMLTPRPGPGLDYTKESVSLANFLDWRASAGTIDAPVGHRAGGTPTSSIARIPSGWPGFFVSSDFFDALGIRPALGRGFVRDDETFGRHRVVVI